MKISFLVILALLMNTCTNREVGTDADSDSTKMNTILKHDTIFINNQDKDWQEGFNLTHDPETDTIWNKPVQYYLADENCSGLASDFYYGLLKPSDDGVTEELLNLVITDNNKLRPFYRWCLNKTIAVQDGALSELTGIPARRYAEKYPQEFFEYMDIDTSGNKLNDWVSSISYSGFYDADDYKKPKIIQQRMAQVMKKNCKNCEAKIIKRIDEFTKECFNEANSLILQ